MFTPSSVAPNFSSGHLKFPTRRHFLWNRQNNWNRLAPPLPHIGPVFMFAFTKIWACKTKWDCMDLPRLLQHRTTKLVQEDHSLQMIVGRSRAWRLEDNRYRWVTLKCYQVDVHLWSRVRAIYSAQFHNGRMKKFYYRAKILQLYKQGNR